ncbi:hypothetical protein [Streptomyces pharetrae]|uniref:hypothetical protein n=1 Tax=Streptomyces pharetrae TaxID=291370 RepID=UPI003D9EBFA5
MKDQIHRPRTDLAKRLDDAVRERWLPRVRERARRQAATSTGLGVDVSGPVRLHRRARHHRRRTDASPGHRAAPQYAARLFDAQDAGADEQMLRAIAAEGLGETVRDQLAAAAMVGSPRCPQRDAYIHLPAKAGRFYAVSMSDPCG